MKSHCINTGEKQGRAKFIPYLGSVSDQCIRENAGKYRTDDSSRKPEQISSVPQVCSKSSVLRKDWIILVFLYCPFIAQVLSFIPCHSCLNTQPHSWMYPCVVKKRKTWNYTLDHKTCTWNCRGGCLIFHSFTTWWFECIFVSITEKKYQLKHWAVNSVVSLVTHS